MPDEPTPHGPAPDPAPAARPALRVRHRRLRWVRERSPWGLVGLAAAVVAFFVLTGMLGWWLCWFRGCPNVDTLASYRPDGAPVLLDREGETFAELKPLGHRVVELETLPPYVGEAFIAVEDRRFRRHDGVDLERVAGALAANLRAGEIEEGSSTITMQLARNVFPDRIPGQEKTLQRKMLEMRVALEIEDEFTKDEILELYLNYIYFGGGARGIDAASRQYFAKPPHELTLIEAALLAALPKAPTYYDPRRHPERAEERRNLVLDLMAEQDKLSAEEAEEAKAAELGVAERRGAAHDETVFAPYFVEQVRRELEREFGDTIYARPLRIRTTLDRTAQAAAEEELDRQLRSIERGGWGRFRGPAYSAAAQPGETTLYLQGAVVLLAADTGDVLAWVGGRDFRQSRFDRVEDARRQIGSAFKPFVYATALARGYPLSARLVDLPLEIPLDRRRTWRPKNFSGTFAGQVSMREALVHSRNVPTVRLAQDLGTAEVARTATDLGMPGERISRTPAMALGTVALSPLELALAYVPFATLGEHVEPRMVLEVETPEGEVLWSSEPESRRVLDPAVAYLVTNVLQDVVRRGTGARVRGVGFRGPAAGKTGTTNDRYDTWFVGFTPEMVGAVWIGFDQPKTIVPGATGGRLAAPVWGRMMRRVSQGRPAPPEWRVPSDVVARQIDPTSGLLLASGCEPFGAAPAQEVFLLGTEPRTVCPSAGFAVAEDDWRSRFREWFDTWGGDGEVPEAGETGEMVVDEDGDGAGIRIERGEDGSLVLRNTGRRTDIEPLGTEPPPPPEEIETDGLPPVERRPPPTVPAPRPPPREAPEEGVEIPEVEPEIPAGPPARRPEARRPRERPPVERPEEPPPGEQPAGDEAEEPEDDEPPAPESGPPDRERVTTGSPAGDRAAVARRRQGRHRAVTRAR